MFPPNATEDGGPDPCLPGGKHVEHVARAHRVPGGQAGLDLEVVEQRSRITHHRAVRVRGKLVRFLREAVTPLVQCDRPVPGPLEAVDDPGTNPIDVRVGNVAVKKEDHGTVSVHLVRQLCTVEGLEARHGG
jgi:hypothetical protein